MKLATLKDGSCDSRLLLVSLSLAVDAGMDHIRLIPQLNDVSLRALAPREMKTRFMHFGDRIRMEARGLDGQPLCGAIDQCVVRGGVACV